MEHEKSCGAVIFKVGKSTEYLLLHYEAGHWDFVKGHVEKNETEEETARRETFEETGLRETRFLSDFRERINYYYRRRGKTVSKEVIFYLVEAIGDEAVTISGEHVGFEWLPYHQAYDRLTYKNAKDTLRKAERYLQSSKSALVRSTPDLPKGNQNP